MKLGTRLLRDAVIGLSELEAALRAQVLYGGRLGTNLIELGFLDVDTVGHFLALALDAPEATRDRFEATPASAIKLFEAELARAHSAFPLGREIDRPDHFGFAVLDPTDEVKQALLAEAIDMPVVLYATAEMRLFYYLEKHYGIERKVRFVRAQSQPREQGQVERRRIQGAPRVVRVEPRRGRSGRVTPIDEERPGVSTDLAPEPPPPEPTPTIRDLGSIRRVLAGATQRDQIGAALTSFGPARVAAIAVMLIRSKTAMGWCAWSAAGGDEEALGQLSIPLTQQSALKLAYDANEPYWGPPPTTDPGHDAALAAAVGITDRGENVLVVPVSVRDRVVNLVVAWGDISGEVRGQLESLADDAGQAYLRLIRGFKVNG